MFDNNPSVGEAMVNRDLHTVDQSVNQCSQHEEGKTLTFKTEK